MERKPLVVINGQVQELPVGDTVPAAASGGGITEENAEEIAVAMAIGLG